MLTEHLFMCIFAYIQKSLPGRMKAMHIYNEPPFFDAVWELFKPLMREKTLNRVGRTLNICLSHYRRESTCMLTMISNKSEPSKTKQNKK